MKNIVYSFSLMALFAYSLKSYGARLATVTANKAIIYADRELKSPIGYAMAGKKIMVGEIDRKRGSITSTVVAGRIAWVQLADLSMDQQKFKSKTPRKSKRFAISKDEFRDKNELADDTLLNNNAVLFSYGILNLNQNFKNFSDSLGVEPNLISSNFNLEMVHRPPYKRTFWSLGIGHFVQSHEEYKWSTFTAQFSYYWTFFKTSLLSLDLYLGGLLSGDFQVRTNNKSTGITSIDSGTAYGYKLGGQIKLFPYSSLGIIAGISQQYLKVNELDPLISSSNQNVLFESIAGINIYFGFTWAL